MQASDPPRRLRFGVFEADLRTGQLTRRGSRVRLQDQPFQVLAALLEKPGELVTREELRSRIWPKTVVDFDHGLNKAVSKIRDALGDSTRFVETVARRGYRFLADVAAVDGTPGPAEDASAQPAPLAVGARPSAWLPRGRRGAVLAGIGLAAVLAAALAWFLSVRTGSSSHIRSLAVLPLENLSGDAGQEYFADGMTDELITRLGQISALRVISRTSTMTYKGTRKPMPQIASELNVDAVVEGSVLRSGERVRITAQLIQLPADKHIWSESYEGDVGDALALQNRVARTIAERVRATLNRQEQAALEGAKTVRPEAYDAYFRGRYFWNQRTGDGLRKAIEYFTLAIDKDPSFAAAYSGLADAYALSGDWEYGILSPQDACARAKAWSLLTMRAFLSLISADCVGSDNRADPQTWARARNPSPRSWPAGCPACPCSARSMRRRLPPSKRSWNGSSYPAAPPCFARVRMPTRSTSCWRGVWAWRSAAARATRP